MYIDNTSYLITKHDPNEDIKLAKHRVLVSIQYCYKKRYFSSITTSVKTHFVNLRTIQLHPSCYIKPVHFSFVKIMSCQNP